MNWIKKIIVDDLWGEYDFAWEVQQQTSVLAGGNGTGKSTVLRSVATLLATGGVADQSKKLFKQIDVLLSDGTVINSTDGCDPTKLQYKTVANFLTPAVDIDMVNDQMFCDMVDAKFSMRNKTIVRGKFPLEFSIRGTIIIGFNELSSGERELLKLYSMARTMANGDVMILDEPEQSLHFEWQETLLEDLQKLSGGKTQMIVTTHSPSIVMDGWVNCIAQIEELVIERD